MAASAKSGPEFVWGATSGLQAPPQGAPVPDPNQDAGPSAAYQGYGVLDVRFWFPKDKVTGYTGVVASHYPIHLFNSNGGVPSALSASNISSVTGVTTGVAMALAVASLGITRNIPIRPFISPQNAVNGNAVSTAAIVLEFGFAFGNVTSGSAVIPVPDTTVYQVGMPLVIGGVGNSAGTAPLLTNIISIQAGVSITVNPNAVPVATNASAPIGLGDIWGPSSNGFPLPQAHMPFMAAGAGLFFDYSQNMGRGIQIVGSSGATGGTFLLAGWDVFWQPMTQLVTVGAGASTGYSAKVFKALASVTPQFTDNSHAYTVGTADLFGFAYFAVTFEDLRVFWAGTVMASTTGFTAGVKTAPTNLTGDVRGTIQTGAAGPGSGIGATASNGSLSSNVMTGNRLHMGHFPGLRQILSSTATSNANLYGNTQA